MTCSFLTKNEHYRLGLAVLAGGEASRYGSNKLLARHPSGNTLVGYVLEQCQPLACDHTIVVTGRYHQALSNALATHNTLKLVENPKWSSGLGGSVAVAASEFLTLPVTHMLIVLGDLAGITTQSLKDLVTASLSMPQSRIASQVEGRGMAPAIFPSHDLATLSHLSGEHGAKNMLNAAHPECIKIMHPEASLDIDTVKDWQKIR